MSLSHEGYCKALSTDMTNESIMRGGNEGVGMKETRGRGIYIYFVEPAYNYAIVWSRQECEDHTREFRKIARMRYLPVPPWLFPHLMIADQP